MAKYKTTLKRTNVTLKLNEGGFRELLKSPEMDSCVRQAAEGIYSRIPELQSEFGVVSKDDSRRAYYKVKATTIHAGNAAKNREILNNLLKAR